MHFNVKEHTDKSYSMCSFSMLFFIIGTKKFAEFVDC